MSTSLCIFNINNLFVRYKFGRTFPGDRSAKSKVEDAEHGYLPIYNLGMWEVFNEAERKLAVQAIKRGSSELPEILCLVEVESMLALRKFNEDSKLLKHGYKYALEIDSRDYRQIDVAVLSNRPILDVRSHVDDQDPANPSKYIFSRDCLEVEFDLENGGKTLTVFLNHLKSKMGDSAQEKQKAAELRKRQAEYVLTLVKSRFGGSEFQEKFFAVVGDLNDEPESEPVLPLTNNSGLVDVLKRLGPKQERWTEWYRGGNSVSQLDYILMSPALDAHTAGKLPYIERRGIGFDQKLQSNGFGPRKSKFFASEGDPTPVEVDFQFPRFAKVDDKNSASDHCPVFMEIP